MTLNPEGAPKPVWVTVEEGGSYILWGDWTFPWESDGSRRLKVGHDHGWKVHSIGFDNGWVFDNYGGWRTWDPSTFLPPAELEFAQKLEALQSTNMKAQRQLKELEEANRKVRESLAEARRVMNL